MLETGIGSDHWQMLRRHGVLIFFRYGYLYLCQIAVSIVPSVDKCCLCFKTLLRYGAYPDYQSLQRNNALIEASCEGQANNVDVSILVFEKISAFPFQQHGLRTHSSSKHALSFSLQNCGICFFAGSHRCWSES